MNMKRAIRRIKRVEAVFSYPDDMVLEPSTLNRVTDAGIFDAIKDYLEGVSPLSGDPTYLFSHHEAYLS